MRVLVAGGAGFLGLHLTKALLDLGHEVTVLDNYSTGWPEADAKRFLGNRGAEVVFCKADVKNVLAGWTADVVFNLACPASPVHYQKDPVDTMLTNVVGTLNLLRLAEDRGARFVQTSTSEIYGDPEVHPQPESYLGRVNLTGPRACYDEGKRAAETMCFDFRRLGRVDARVVRIFNTYGPWMHKADGRVISNFVGQAISGAPITVFGDGMQTRSLCYVDDLVRGLIAAATVDDLDVPVNLGNPEEFTVLYMAEAIRDFVGSSSPIVFSELPEDDPKVRRPDISRAKELLGWEPTVPFREGLRHTAEYFRGVLS